MTKFAAAQKQAAATFNSAEDKRLKLRETSVTVHAVENKPLSALTICIL